MGTFTADFYAAESEERVDETLTLNEDGSVSGSGDIAAGES